MTSLPVTAYDIYMRMVMEESRFETYLWFDMLGIDQVVHAKFATPQEGVL